jgi:sporulation protein YlmC with PRC-barrel domain
MATFDETADNRISRDEYLAAGGALSASAAGAGTGESERMNPETSAADEGIQSSTTSEPGDESQAGTAAGMATGTAAGEGTLGTGSTSGDTTAGTQSSSESAATTSEPGDESQAGTAAGTAAGEGTGDTSTDESMQQSEATGTEGSTTESMDSSETGTAAEGQMVYTDAEMQQLASDLIGKNLVNSNDEDLGEIEDFVVDDDGGAVFAIAGIGGFLGIGERDIAVPFEDLEIREDDVLLMTPMTKEQLKEMPPYEEGTWRSLNAE